MQSIDTNLIGVQDVGHFMHWLQELRKKNVDAETKKATTAPTADQQPSVASSSA